MDVIKSFCEVINVGFDQPTLLRFMHFSFDMCLLEAFDEGFASECFHIVFVFGLRLRVDSNAASPRVNSENEKNEIIFLKWVKC